MIRWVTPVKEFMRTATEDTEVGGVHDRGGRVAATSPTRRPTATRTSSTTRSASTSAATRTSTSPSASASTYCLGAQLARLETRAFFAELLPRLESIELAGRPEWWPRPSSAA